MNVITYESAAVVGLSLNVVSLENRLNAGCTRATKLLTALHGTDGVGHFLQVIDLGSMLGVNCPVLRL